MTALLTLVGGVVEVKSHPGLSEIFDLGMSKRLFVSLRSMVVLPSAVEGALPIAAEGSILDRIRFDQLVRISILR